MDTLPSKRPVDGAPQRAYAVQAFVHGRQVATFYLLANVQGIVSTDHARRIAAEIMDAGSPNARGTADALSGREGSISVQEVTL